MRLESDGTRFAVRKGPLTVASGELRCYHGHWTLREGHVLPKWRGQGFQRILIRARLDQARLNGAKRVLAWTRPTNSYSLNNLVAEGFRFIPGRVRRFDGVEYMGLQCRFS